jgi:hypothetical protein
MKLNPETTTIIDDGQFRYPVATADLTAFEAAHGKIGPANYEKFCDEVDHLMPKALPGSAEMIDECTALAEAGAREYRPA